MESWRKFKNVIKETAELKPGPSPHKPLTAEELKALYAKGGYLRSPHPGHLVGTKLKYEDWHKNIKAIIAGDPNAIPVFSYYEPREIKTPGQTGYGSSIEYVPARSTIVNPRRRPDQALHVYDTLTGHRAGEARRGRRGIEGTKRTGHLTMGEPKITFIPTKP